MYECIEARRRSKRRKIETTDDTEVPSNSDSTVVIPNIPAHDTQNDKECQTEEAVYSNLDFLSFTSTIRKLEEEKVSLLKENENLKKKLAFYIEKDYNKKQLKSPAKKKNLIRPNAFSAENVANSKVKNIFEYYTGLTYVRFMMLVPFLFPNDETNPVTYKEKRKEVQDMKLSEQLFLVLCRLRNGLHIKDLAYRFNIKQQSVSLIFNSVIHYMYLKLGSLSYWPHRDVIIDNMPKQYRDEFPTCLAIIDY